MVITGSGADMYLLFYKGTKENPKSTWVDNTICQVTQSKFSHVELAYRRTKDVYHCWSSSPRDGGVRQKDIDISSGKWEVVNIKRKQVKSEDWFMFEAATSTGYDYLGVVGTVIQYNWFNSKDKWFCSEIVAEALGKPESWRYSPEDLHKIYNVR